MNFCDTLLEELNRHNTVRICRDNPNDHIQWANIMRLLDWCDVAYLEWMQPPNIEISQIQSLDKPLIMFIHGIDLMNHHFMDWRNIAGLITQPANFPRLLKLRDQWKKDNPGKPPLTNLPKEILIRTIGFVPDKFIPKGPIEPEYHIITHSSFIRPVKGIYTAIQQFHDILRLDGDKPWKMTIIGNWGGEYKWSERAEYVIACRELIDQLEFPANRLFIKPTDFPQDQWVDFIQTGDLFWCTSWRESMGVSLAEACATGCYPLINNFIGANTMYPDAYLCNSPMVMVQKTIDWGNLNNETKMKERNIIQKHITSSFFDARESARQISTFIETVVEGYKK